MTEQGGDVRPPTPATDRREGARPAGAHAHAPPARLATVATGGLEFAAAILVCLFGGQWLDARLGSAPWMLILGVALGAGTGVYSMYRTLTTAQRHASSRTVIQPATPRADDERRP